MSHFRLPGSVIPTCYNLYLYPNLISGTFNGRVITTANVLYPTEEIIMHSNKLKINAIEVDEAETTFEVKPDYEQLVIRKVDGTKFVNPTLKATVEFEGTMNKIVGFYRSSYKNKNGESRYMATSKFEPTYARQAYPCFDEPNLKATFKVHLLKPKDTNYIALSNFPQIGTEEESNGILVHFAETVPMSTYLSCFIVSDFICSETNFNNGNSKVPLRVYASPDQLTKTKYAGEIGAKVIEYYVDYFHIPYPLPKLDMVAVPDFVSGAMEHWGLVTFRETALLYTNDTHSSSNKQRVATVVAHELAHSWFGNLVTMNWWNDLWLNEGFATYISYKGVEEVENTWNMMEQFQVMELHPVLSLDSMIGSHAIIKTVTTPDQITEVFDSISYNKGASLLRMLENTVGSEIFQNSVTSYLNRYKFRNAISQNLYDELQANFEDGAMLSNFMETFTRQAGYPVLDVDINGDEYTLKQKRFLKDANATDTADSVFNFKWTIPIRYITDIGQSEIFWFKYNQSEVKIIKPHNAKWLKFNPSQIGYYRVNYPEDEWTSLSNCIMNIPTPDRTHLLEESFRLAEAGKLQYNVPLNLSEYLINDVNYCPWKVASLCFGELQYHLQTSSEKRVFQQYVVSLLKPLYCSLSWNEETNDSHLKKFTRTLILNLACMMKFEDALEEAKDKFDVWINNNVSVSHNLKEIVYQYGVIEADQETWEKLLAKFKQETDASEKIKLMLGLASIKNTKLIDRLLEISKDESVVRGQDYFTLLQYMSSNSSATEIVWTYVRKNWSSLVEKFTLNDRYLGQLIPNITRRFSTESKLTEMKEFFKEYPEAGAGTVARIQALERVKNNIKWLEVNKSTVEKWLQLKSVSM